MAIKNVIFSGCQQRTEFWQEKIYRNQTNDSRAIDLLLANNWRVCIVWECSIRGAKKDPEKVISTIAEWLTGDELFLEVRETPRD